MLNPYVLEVDVRNYHAEAERKAEHRQLVRQALAARTLQPAQWRRVFARLRDLWATRSNAQPTLEQQ